MCPIIHTKPMAAMPREMADMPCETADMPCELPSPPASAAQELNLKVIDANGHQHDVRTDAARSVHGLLHLLPCAKFGLARQLGSIMQGTAPLDRYESLAAYGLRDGDVLSYAPSRTLEGALCALADDADRAHIQQAAQIAQLQQLVGELYAEKAVAAGARGSPVIRVGLPAPRQVDLDRADELERISSLLARGDVDAQANMAALQAATRMAADPSAHAPLIQIGVLDLALRCVRSHNDVDSTMLIQALQLARWIAGSSGGRAALRLMRFADAVFRIPKRPDVPELQPAVLAVLRMLASLMVVTGQTVGTFLAQARSSHRRHLPGRLCGVVGQI